MKALLFLILVVWAASYIPAIILALIASQVVPH